MSDVAKARFTDYDDTVTRALNAIGAAGRLPADRPILIKPNLTNADGPPVTTPVEAAEAVVKYCRRNSSVKILIAEGCGSGTTDQAFAANGYTDLAARLDVELIDLNTAPSLVSRRDDTLHWKEFHLPQIAREAFIISLPILKDHSFTVTTIAMKNMFGLAPAPFYEGTWNKSALHRPSTHWSVVDICLHRAPDLCIVDAAVALAGMHLAGTPTRLDTVLASFDPVAVDAVASALLGHDPRRIEYLALADGRLGSLDGITVIDG